MSPVDGVLEHAALQVTKPPGHLAVIVARRRRPRARSGTSAGPTPAARTWRGSVSSARRVNAIVDTSWEFGTDLDDSAARRQVALKVRANEVRAGRKVAERETPVAAGHGECGRRAERRDDRAGNRLSAIVEHETEEISLRKRRNPGDRLRRRAELCETQEG